MTNVLMYDTETTGLPFYGSQHPSDAVYQPRMCSIAMALLSQDGTVLERWNALIKPKDWPLDSKLFMDNFKQASEKAHGLTMEKLEAEGVAIEDAHEAWKTFYAQAEVTSGYNTWFDHKIVRGEWKRLGHPVQFGEKQAIEIMKLCTPFCKLESMRPGGGFKFPKLKEAVELLLGRPPGGSHDSLHDLNDTIDLYKFLVEKGAVVAENQPAAKLPA